MCALPPRAMYLGTLTGVGRLMDLMAAATIAPLRFNMALKIHAVSTNFGRCD
jgi:hypothetical protein